jgi:hypothetical protein
MRLAQFAVRVAGLAQALALRAKLDRRLPRSGTLFANLVILSPMTFRFSEELLLNRSARRKRPALQTLSHVWILRVPGNVMESV